MLPLEDRHSLADWLLFIHADSVVSLLESGGLAREELPREHVAIYETARYLGQVDNGGHAQYIGNYGMPFIWSEYVAYGLENLELLGHRDNFLEFVAFLQSNSEEATRAAGSIGFSDLGNFDCIIPFDKRYFALEGSKPAKDFEQIADWLREVPTTKWVTRTSVGDEIARVLLSGSRWRSAKHAGAARFVSEQQAVEAQSMLNTSGYDKFETAFVNYGHSNNGRCWEYYGANAIQPLKLTFEKGSARLATFPDGREIAARTFTDDPTRPWLYK